MEKEKKGGKLIIVFGIICVIIATICAFGKEAIINKYYEYSIRKKYSNSVSNDYYLEDNFDYVENYDNTTIKSKSDLINFLYYTLNSGIVRTERYIDSSYVDYENDINNLTNNDGEELQNIISILNNFVHPYNSSNNIVISYGGKYLIGLSIKREYTAEEIELINDKVNDVIKEKTDNSMPIKEKIKVIHDYIIDNTEYDRLKYDNKDDTTYKSNTAYGVLFEGYGTCNGYADAMAIFLDKMNVINYKISNDEHIWNLVYLDGKWYHLDLTWDDPISDTNINRDTYFLIDTATLEEINDGTHTYDKNIYIEAK